MRTHQTLALFVVLLGAVGARAQTTSWASASLGLTLELPGDWKVTQSAPEYELEKRTKGDQAVVAGFVRPDGTGIVMVILNYSELPGMLDRVVAGVQSKMEESGRKAKPVRKKIAGREYRILPYRSETSPDHSTETAFFEKDGAVFQIAVVAEKKQTAKLMQTILKNLSLDESRRLPEAWCAKPPPELRVHDAELTGGEWFAGATGIHFREGDGFHLDRDLSEAERVGGRWRFMDVESGADISAIALDIPSEDADRRRIFTADLSRVLGLKEGKIWARAKFDGTPIEFTEGDRCAAAVIERPTLLLALTLDLQNADAEIARKRLPTLLGRLRLLSEEEREERRRTMFRSPRALRGRRRGPSRSATDSSTSGGDSTGPSRSAPTGRLPTVVTASSVSRAAISVSA